jgi:hypothetical protein
MFTQMHNAISQERCIVNCVVCDDCVVPDPSCSYFSSTPARHPYALDVAELSAPSGPFTRGNRCPRLFHSFIAPFNCPLSLSTSTSFRSCQTASFHPLSLGSTPSRSNSSTALTGIMGWRRIPAIRRDSYTYKTGMVVSSINHGSSFVNVLFA